MAVNWDSSPHKSRGSLIFTVNRKLSGPKKNRGSLWERVFPRPRTAELLHHGASRCVCMCVHGARGKKGRGEGEGSKKKAEQATGPTLTTLPSVAAAAPLLMSAVGSPSRLSEFFSRFVECIIFVFPIWSLSAWSKECHRVLYIAMRVMEKIWNHYFRVIFSVFHIYYFWFTFYILSVVCFAMRVKIKIFKAVVLSDIFPRFNIYFSLTFHQLSILSILCIIPSSINYNLPPLI